MEIRKSTTQDISQIMEIFKIARNIWLHMGIRHNGVMDIREKNCCDQIFRQAIIM